MKLTARVAGTDAMIARMKRYPETVQRSTHSILRQEGRGLAVQLAKVTVPFGFSEKSKQAGERAVSRDMNVTFMTPSRVFAKLERVDKEKADAFWKQIRGSRYARAQEILRNSGTEFSSVPLGQLSEGIHKFSARPAGPKQIVTSDKKLAAAIARRQKRVGYAKGAWINAGKALGGRIRGAAQWATRHKTAPGSGHLKIGGSEPTVQLTNRLDYVEAVTLPSGVAIALRVAQRKLQLALLNSLNRTNRRRRNAA